MLYQIKKLEITSGCCGKDHFNERAFEGIPFMERPLEFIRALAGGSEVFELGAAGSPSPFNEDKRGNINGFVDHMYGYIDAETMAPCYVGISKVG